MVCPFIHPIISYKQKTLSRHLEISVSSATDREGQFIFNLHVYSRSSGVE